MYTLIYIVNRLERSYKNNTVEYCSRGGGTENSVMQIIWTQI